MVSSVSFFIGALFPTYVLTAIFNWLLRHHAAPIPRMMMANGLSLFVVTVVGGFGLASGKDPNFASAFASFALPQLIWLIVGIVRHNRGIENKLPEIARQPEHVEPLFETPIPSDPETPQVTVAEPLEEVRQPPVTAAHPRRFNNFVARNWRGELPLWVSYWGCGFLGNIIVGLIALVAVGAFSVNAGYEPRTIFITLVTIWLGVLVAASLDRPTGPYPSGCVGRYAGLQISKPRQAATLLAVILGFLRLVEQFVNAGAPQITESYRVAFMDDPDIPAYSIRIMRNGTEAEITGGFKYGLSDDFLRIVRVSPQIRVVHLNSIGGRIGEAEKLNKLIRDYGLVTYVSHQCISACTLAFSGGHERWLREGAVLGFHAPAFPGWSDADLAYAVTVQKDLFAAAGFDPGFISRALATPNKDVWIPLSDELLRARAITAVSDGSNFAASGYGGNVAREQMATKLTNVLPVLGTMKERFPTDYAAIVDGFYDSYVSGQTQTEIFAAARSKLLPIIAAYRPLADDAVLVDLGKLLAEQYAALGAKDPTLCYLYASGAGGARDFSPDIPGPLIQRDIALGERVIATAAKRPDVTEQMTTPLWEKVGGQLEAEKIKLLANPKPDPSKYGDYCAALVALFQGITSLKQDEAGLLMRQTLSGKLSTEPASPATAPIVPKPPTPSPSPPSAPAATMTPNVPRLAPPSSQSPSIAPPLTIPAAPPQPTQAITWDNLVASAQQRSAEQNNGTPDVQQSCQPELQVCSYVIAFNDQDGIRSIVRRTVRDDGTLVERGICQFNLSREIRTCVNFDSQIQTRARRLNG